VNSPIQNDDETTVLLAENELLYRRLADASGKLLQRATHIRELRMEIGRLQARNAHYEEHGEPRSRAGLVEAFHNLQAKYRAKRDELRKAQQHIDKLARQVRSLKEQIADQKSQDPTRSRLQQEIEGLKHALSERDEWARVHKTAAAREILKGSQAAERLALELTHLKEKYAEELETRRRTLWELNRERNAWRNKLILLEALLPTLPMRTRGTPNECDAAVAEWGVYEQVAEIIGAKLPQPCTGMNFSLGCALAEGHEGVCTNHRPDEE
jgi:chromosome segregation ATPase